MTRTKLACLTFISSLALGLSLPGCSDDGGDTGTQGTGTGDGDPGDGDPGDGDPGDGDPGDGDPGDGDPGDGDPGDGDPGDGDGDAGLSFAGDVYPIIMANCGCHVGGAPAGLAMPNAMTAYTNLVNVPSSQEPNLNRVTPGDGDNSYLYQKIAALQANISQQNKQMPNTGTPMSANPLSDPDQTLIFDWIMNGAAP